ncbi:hypothetical protein RR46_11931 [Papilio xuthus]|uniref:Uncharacterized protein n=1 Tax=Papilio xuthus TaxID=66420 RepID=A0A194PNN5_PAPXU|nr:hypothetical protein RR46_11931 [Papilio xuthus]
MVAYSQICERNSKICVKSTNPHLASVVDYGLITLNFGLYENRKCSRVRFLTSNRQPSSSEVGAADEKKSPATRFVTKHIDITTPISHGQRTTLRPSCKVKAARFPRCGAAHAQCNRKHNRCSSGGTARCTRSLGHLAPLASRSGAGGGWGDTSAVIATAVWPFLRRCARPCPRGPHSCARLIVFLGCRPPIAALYYEED